MCGEIDGKDGTILCFEDTNIVGTLLEGKRVPSPELFGEGIAVKSRDGERVR